MLVDFITFLKKHSLHFEDEIKDIPHTSCSSSIKVIDFDKMKDEFSSKIGVTHKLKSVDAIFISPATNTLYLIEMKRKDISSTKSWREFIEKKLKILPQKIVDSLFIYWV